MYSKNCFSCSTEVRFAPVCIVFVLCSWVWFSKLDILLYIAKTSEAESSSKQKTEETAKNKNEENKK